MLGTIVNTLAVIFGSILGIIIKGKFKQKYQIIITQAIGMSVLFIGISGALGSMFDENANPILFIISLVIGSIIGEFFDIEGKLSRFGNYLESKFKGNENSISKSFVSGSLLFCVGTMSILGSLESGLQGVHNTLYAKSVLDGVMAIIFASTLGIGVLFAAVTIFIYQGTITIFASFIQPYFTQDMIREMSIVGGVLITGLGLDLLNIKKVKVGNMLPAIFIPVIYYLILGILN